jgi:hypothetical protein
VVITNYVLPEAISCGKVYFTRGCFPLVRAARQLDHLPFKINPGGSLIPINQHI